MFRINVREERKVVSDVIVERPVVEAMVGLLLKSGYVAGIPSTQPKQLSSADETMEAVDAGKNVTLAMSDSLVNFLKASLTGMDVSVIKLPN